jgi:hypothetical protein
MVANRSKVVPNALGFESPGREVDGLNRRKLGLNEL